MAKKGQLYLELFHGRTNPEQQMDDWGSQGPIFGPLSYVHTTYAKHVKLGEAEEPYDNGADLFVVDDLLYYDKVYYGDWSVFTEDQLTEEMKGRIVKYCERKANV